MNLLDGMLAVRDANRRFRLELPEGGSYTTVAGFMLAQAGRLLKPGEEIRHAGAIFKVERVDRRRIRRVRLTPPPSHAGAATEAPQPVASALILFVGLAALGGAQLRPFAGLLFGV